MTAGGTIFLWDAGAASGTAGSPGAAFEAAAPYLAGGAEARVEEAEVALQPAGGGGFLSEHRRTGRAWLGRLEDGVPAWEPAEPEALAG